MADVLDQSEVDALLSAVDSGNLDEAALSSGFGSDETAIRKEVRTYDFKRPERVSKDQMRSLESIHEGFARNLGASLSGFLRTIVEVRVATIEQLTYSEFIHSLPNPTNFNLLTADPLEGQMCLEISPLIIYPIIDRLLGGSSADMFIPQRPLTMIELRLVKRITDRALECLTEVWSNLVAVSFTLAEVESNPHLVQIVAPNEVVVVIGFEIKMNTRVGTMSLCIPFNVIEPVMSKLATQGWLAYQRRASVEDKSQQITNLLHKAPLDLTVYLAQTTITVRDLVSLQPGDILQTTKPSGVELILQVRGKNKFAGVMGRHKRNYAFKITRKALEDESL
ncbi:MAG: flagellar motor switch protein FliM [Phycisphaerae bacterium]|nr:flagellar motor switch protein FliM [Phycisphaerae bacterium]